MPVNIPFDKPVSQDLYAGTSEQQVDALTDLLMHFDTFAKQNLSLEAYLKQQPVQQPAAGAQPASQPAARLDAAPAPAAGQPATVPTPDAEASRGEKASPEKISSRRPGVALN
jgi:hypothetical protein